MAESKPTQEGLRASEIRYRRLFESARDGILILNAATLKITDVNPFMTELLGYSRAEFLGRELWQIGLFGDKAQSQAAFLELQQTGYIRYEDLPLQTRQGERREVEFVSNVYREGSQQVIQCNVRDISKRKQAEAQLLRKVEELNRSNEELEQFAYIASHDLQEPLRMVASYTQLLSRRYRGKLDSDADEFIAFAVDGASRMQRLIQDLLTFSRVRTKGKELLDTSSEEALQHALINLQGAIEEGGALVTHDPLPIVLADPMQLIQLFQNLIGNAIKYQAPGVPKVHISAAKNGGEKWLFSVQDNGLGIDSQYFDRIFGMFQRLHKREEFDGTGIGLAICKKIVERHGGSISVESTQGQGSTFRFALEGSERKSI